MYQPRTRFKTGGQAARQQRRQKAAGKRKFREDIKDFDKDFDTAWRCFEGGGGRLVVVRPEQVLNALMAVAGGDVDAESVVGSVLGFASRCAEIPPGDPNAPQCLCKRTFDAASPFPEALTIITPPLKGGMAVVTGVCAECAKRSDHELKAEQLRQLQKIWSDARITGVMNAATES
jgi:hypothetical protein